MYFEIPKIMILPAIRLLFMTGGACFVAFSPLIFAKQHKSPIPKDEAITCSQNEDFKPKKDAPMKVEGSCSDIAAMIKNFKINVWNDLMPSIGKKKFPGHILIESGTGELEKIEVKSGYLLAPTGLLKISLKLEKTARDVSMGQASQYHLYSPEKINLSHKLYLTVFYKKQLFSLKINLPDSIQETY
jgi:hypothetical protein